MEWEYNTYGGYRDNIVCFIATGDYDAHLWVVSDGTGGFYIEPSNSRVPIVSGFPTVEAAKLAAEVLYESTN